MTVKVTKLGSPTREQMRRWLALCEREPVGVWENCVVEELLRYCLDLDDELERVHQAVKWMRSEHADHQSNTCYGCDVLDALDAKAKEKL